MERFIMSTPGIADPYFYEWYVGIKCLVEMLNTDSYISCVIFQHELYDTIDDVVVEYNNGNREICYQIKHEISTSTKHNLTFGKLIEKNSKSESNCLLDALFQGWKKASSDSTKKITPVLYTNRGSGSNNTARVFDNNNYTAYPIKEFLVKIKYELGKTNDYCNILIEDKNLLNQWNELCSSIKNASKDEIAYFLQYFQISDEEPGLVEIEKEIISSLMLTFSCNEGLAYELLGKIVFGLRKWVTTSRETSRVTIEDVYTALGIENDIDESQHRLAPPFPFFDSRKRFSESIKKQICSSNKKVVFISGNPGSGKTSVISYLQSNYEIFLLRYHTFRPISPEQHFYNIDAGICSSDALWGTLLIQLRQKLSGKLAKYSVPVNNKLLTTEKKREHVCRLLGIMAKELTDSKRIYICIDGIDHAARSQTSVSFLSSLPSPNEIPDGVCFVIVGQPYNMYQDQYPTWLSSNNEVEQIAVPNIESDDIKQLIIETVPQFKNNAKEISSLVYSFTKGNNLSSVFAVEEIKKAQSPEEAISILKGCGITYDIQQYYSHIWNHAKKIILEMGLGVSFPESIIACPIILMNGRVRIRILANALPYHMNENDWKMVLNKLYPLIIPCNEENSEYMLFHNDFRIFLMNIINRYQERYIEIAFSLAEYLLVNDEGISSYVLPIQLLQCANRTDLIPQYFTSDFVINALSEGVSKQRLDEYAHLSYNAACSNHDMEGYINTYLALSTLYQHQRYIEYYGKSYISHDAPELCDLDISEVRSLPLSEQTIGEYTNVLKLCVKLYLNNEKKRSIELFNRWFSQLTPFSFVQFMKSDETIAGNYITVNNKIRNVINDFGETTAFLKLEPPLIEKAVNDDQKKAVSIFGKAYFDYCIGHGLLDFAIIAIQRGYVMVNCFFGQLDNIYYNGYTDKFANYLLKAKDYKNEETTNFFPVAMYATYRQCDNLALETSELTEFSDKIYDKTSLEMIIKSFLVGVIEHNYDDIVICGHVTKCFDKIRDDISIKNQIIDLCKFSSLLGKYYWNENACNSSTFIKYAKMFLTARLIREHDYSSAYKFLIFTLFNSKAAYSLRTNEIFILSLKSNLLEYGSLGMYYKTYILNYLKKIGRNDIIKEHIEELYGENCHNISIMEEKSDLHKMFCPYGELVAPDLMNTFTNMLKWDVVGYVGHKECALSGLFNELEMILSSEPSLWREYGLKLYCQSKIASISGNEYDYEIIKCILLAAISCGIEDFEELHLLNDEFRMDSNLIYESIFMLADKATSIEDINALWLLNCGIHSWYTNEDRIGMKHVYNLLLEKSQSLGIDLNQIVANNTPQWSTILKHLSEVEKSTPNITNDYFLQRQEAIEKYSELCSGLDTDGFLEFISQIPLLKYSSDIYKIVIEYIKSGELLNRDIKNCLLASICTFTKGREWSYSDLTESINSILNLFGEESFWILATNIEDYLSEYNYQTSTRNIQMLLIQSCKMKITDVKYLFNQELETQNKWITANNHFEVSEEITLLKTTLICPKAISDIVPLILLEQIETHNARKIETAIYSLYVLGVNSSYVIETVIKNISNFSSFQKEWIYPIIYRWAAERKIPAELFNILLNEYKSCNALSQKYYLHSILLKEDDDQIELDSINYDALPVEYVLPSTGETDIRSVFEQFLLFREKGESSDYNDDIRRYISSNTIEHTNADGIYCGRNDLFLPMQNYKVDCMLYGEGTRGRWDDLPLIYNKCSLLKTDDPYLLTDIPKIIYNTDWFPNIYKDANRGKCNLDIKVLSEIALSNINEDEMVVAAAIWYPIDYKSFLKYYLTTKIGSIYDLYNDDGFDTCIGNYGLLASEGNIIEHCTSYSFSQCLFNIVFGSIYTPFGNCQMAPSLTWRKVLNCTPSDDSPYLWRNEAGIDVLRFERWASPIYEDIGSVYYSQPILFRWICKKEWLNQKTAEMNLRTWNAEKIEEIDSCFE